jgi:hypothetical protein
MNTAVEFRKHAADCETTARLTKDPESKAVWKGMAERWLLCAKLAEDEDVALRRRREEKAHAGAVDIILRSKPSCHRIG